MAASNGTMLTNNTISHDHDVLIQELNDKMADQMVPATVFISTMMVLSLVGNPMVCYYYGAKTKLTTNTFFIVILALYDVIVCAISVPGVIADMKFFYTFENNVACKLLRFVNYFGSIGSILTLIAIAMDRFKKICRLTKPQMGIRTAKLVSLGSIGIAIMLSWPCLAIFGSIQVPIPNTYGLDLMGADCTFTKDVAYQKYVWIFNGVLFVLSVGLSVILIVLYSIIVHTILSHKKRLIMHKPRKNRASSSTEVETSLTDCSHTADDKLKEKEKGEIKTLLATKSLAPRNDRHSTASKKSTNAQKESGIDSEAVKITVVMVIVNIVFIVSFLPYLSLCVWVVFKSQHESEFLSGAGLVLFKIGTRSFIFNSSLNPWIYGIFNSNFRHFYFGWLCRKR
ncbi:probable G-protein coupled receptor No18 isoform X2 [Dreissena polymorpha]|nr:probable G-protein coupled receptor No18 isoform X2 [Dreissena polymorpha]